MALTIYKIVDSIRWRAGTTIIRPTSEGGIYTPPVSLANYYTKTELNVDGGASVHFRNLIEAYHNNLLDIQGGLDTSSGDSSGYDAEYYHLDATTYYDIVNISFIDSIVKDSINAVSLVNDLDTPGNNKYYGTNSGGTKGWFDLSQGTLQAESGVEQYQIAIFTDTETITGSSNFTYNSVSGVLNLSAAEIYLGSHEITDVNIQTISGTVSSPDGVSLAVVAGNNYEGGTPGDLALAAGQGFGNGVIGANTYIFSGDTAGNDSVAGNLYMFGGIATGSGTPGHVYLSAGFNANFEYGNIYLSGEPVGGTAYNGCLPLVDSSDLIYVVTYDPDTGKLGYTQLI